MERYACGFSLQFLWTYTQLYRLFFVLAVVLKEGDVSGTSCDPGFKRAVENCLRPLQGFPVLTRERTLMTGDWAKTDVICKWKLVHSASLCLSSVYAVCPQSKVQRSLCGFQSLDPKLLVQYGDLICRHKDVLKQQSRCLNSSLCSVKECLREYDPSIPSRLSSGIWKSPLYTPYCSYHAYAEHCHEKVIFYQCGTDLYYVQMDILKNTRPSSCTDQLVRKLKTNFRLNEIDVIFNGASDWTKRDWKSVTTILIGVALMVTFDWLHVFDIR